MTRIDSIEVTRTCQTARFPGGRLVVWVETQTAGFRMLDWIYKFPRLVGDGKSYAETASIVRIKFR